MASHLKKGEEISHRRRRWRERYERARRLFQLKTQLYLASFAVYIMHTPPRTGVGATAPTGRRRRARTHLEFEPQANFTHSYCYEASTLLKLHTIFSRYNDCIPVFELQSFEEYLSLSHTAFSDRIQECLREYSAEGHDIYCNTCFLSGGLMRGLSATTLESLLAEEVSLRNRGKKELALDVRRRANAGGGSRPAVKFFRAHPRDNAEKVIISAGRVRGRLWGGRRATALPRRPGPAGIFDAWEDSRDAIDVICDLSKAFDYIHHDTLIGKLHHHDVTGQSLWFLKYYSRDGEPNKLVGARAGGSRVESIMIGRSGPPALTRRDSQQNNSFLK
ncbi:hypothetical protein EVAR_9956_1 [Eumeta japonica]|uniref:Reverse transcriptase domain-containing protein n=1 Tax=Eumeta variegata TaxID=151549 RepID=A0A4C1TQW6_EUMVA|nr:hypothetical protein EVAR_9956_1 [Eumeta japonica]